MTHRSGYVEADSWDSNEEVAIQRAREVLGAMIRRDSGQSFLRRMVAALDAMPVKELARGGLVRDGQCCAMGALCVAEGIDPMALCTAIVTHPDGSKVERTLGEEIAELIAEGYDRGDDSDGFFADAENRAAETAAEKLDVPFEIACEAMWVNDEIGNTGAERWRYMRKWAAKQLVTEQGAQP